MATCDVKDLSNDNPILQDKIDELNKSNSFENMDIKEVLRLILKEAQETNRQLRKINK